jgi:hypothetical protein
LIKLPPYWKLQRHRIFIKHYSLGEEVIQAKGTAIAFHDPLCKFFAVTNCQLNRAVAKFDTNSKDKTASIFCNETYEGCEITPLGVHQCNEFSSFHV